MCSRLGCLLAAFLSVSAVTAGCGDDAPLGPTPPEPFAVSAVSPTAGFSGQTVAVTGSGFLPGAAVTFGGTQAVSIVVSSPRISATVPTLPGATVDIVVRNPDGQQGRLAAAFTIETLATDNRTVSLTASPRIVGPGGG